MAPASSSNPLFLICNDDGVHAPGVRILAKALEDIGEAVIVAPHVERSASGHGISIAVPLRVEEIEHNIFAVEGTPADCVMLACKRLLHRRPTWVLSGINRGGNLGMDTIYSGTVGAAMEGCIQGYPAMAISAQGKPKERMNYESAAGVVKLLLKNESLLFEIMGKGVLNINVPNLPLNQIRGVKTAVMGRKIYSEDLVQGIDPRGRAYYWIGAGGEMFEDIPGSDCVLLDQGFATLSILRPSYLDEKANERLGKKLESSFKFTDELGVSH